MERDTAEEILCSAEAVFAEYGYGGARIKEIAGRVGVTNAVVHYYFRTKEELYRAVLHRMVAELADLAARIAPEPLEPVPKLRRFFYGFFDFAARHPQFARLWNLEMGHSDQEFFLDLVREHLAPLYQRARGFLQHGVELGVFRPLDPGHLLTAIYGMIVSYFSDSPFLQAMLGEEVMEGEMIARRRDELMEMILRIVLVDPEG